jgi:hypothetical protein
MGDLTPGVFFTLNGAFLGVAFRVPVTLSSKLYPTLGFSLSSEVTFNFGQQPFKYNLLRRDWMVEGARHQPANLLDAVQFRQRIIAAAATEPQTPSGSAQPSPNRIVLRHVLRSMFRQHREEGTTSAPQELMLAVEMMADDDADGVGNEDSATNDDDVGDDDSVTDDDEDGEDVEVGFEVDDEMER